MVFSSRPASSVLETARLSLRPMTLEHVPLLVELDSDPEVMRFLTNGRPSTVAEVEEIVAETTGSRWVAHERVSGDFVGWFGIRPAGVGEYELGYRLCRAAWGRGLATEGVAAVLQVAFEVVGARRVWAQTMAVNVRSRAVMERCGLRHVRTFHEVFDDPIPGTEFGEVEYETMAPPQGRPVG